MAVAVAVLGPEDITFILCVSTSQDTVSCEVSIFVHWLYCFQQKIPLPDATASWRGEKSQQAKCQGTCPSSLCVSSVTWFTGSFSKGKHGRSASLDKREQQGHFLHPLNSRSCWRLSFWQQLGSRGGCAYRCPFKLLLNLPWSPDFTSSLISSWERAWDSFWAAEDRQPWSSWPSASPHLPLPGGWHSWRLSFGLGDSCFPALWKGNYAAVKEDVEGSHQEGSHQALAELEGLCSRVPWAPPVPQGGQAQLEGAVDGGAAPQGAISSCCRKATLPIASFVSIQTQQILE